MKKSAILATAIAAVIAAPLAGAAGHGGKDPAVTVYGKVHVSVTNEDVTDRWVNASNSSRIGFKGSEDLGNGMKAVWKYEQGFRTDGGGWDGNSRNTYLGLAGGFGTVLVGRHDTPAKSALYAAGNERLGDSIIDLHGSFGFSELRADNVIAYVAPKMGDLGISVALVQGEAAKTVPTDPDAANGLADALSLGVTYSAGGIKAGFGYTDGADLTGNGTAELMNIGGSYAVSDMINVGLQYQTVETKAKGAGALAAERTAMALTASFGLGGGNSVALMVGTAEDDDNVAGNVDPESDNTGVAFIHKFSKRTSAYVAYMDSDDLNAAGGVARTGMANPWIGNGGTTINGSRFGVGLAHTF